MTKHNATNATDKRNAIRILANGDATVAEVARLLGTSRQLVAHWAKAAGLEPVALRADRLERLWQDERQALIADHHGHRQPGPLILEAHEAANLIARLLPKRKRLK